MANVSDELLQLRKRARRRLVGAIALVIFALTVLWTALDGEPPKTLVEGQSVEIISSAPALASVASISASAVASEVVVATAPDLAEPTPLDASRVAPVAIPGKLVNHQAVAANNDAKSPDSAIEKPVADKTTPKPVAEVSAKPVVKATPKPTAKPLETKAPAADPKAILEGSTTKTSDAKSTNTKTATIYYIQIGAFADEAKAQQTLKKLNDAGIPARGEKVTTAKGELTRVRIGPGSDEAKAKAWMQRLQALGVPGTLVTKAAQ